MFSSSGRISYHHQVRVNGDTAKVSVTINGRRTNMHEYGQVEYGACRGRSRRFGNMMCLPALGQHYTTACPLQLGYLIEHVAEFLIDLID